MLNRVRQQLLMRVVHASAEIRAGEELVQRLERWVMVNDPSTSSLMKSLNALDADLQRLQVHRASLRQQLRAIGRRGERRDSNRWPPFV